LTPATGRGMRLSQPMALPPGPREPPALQTARWLTRPIAFMQDCRERFGDHFSVRFVGFRTPLVMVSHPSTIRALYATSENGLPPGRTFALRPLLGARSILLLEGREHLERRRVMLPPFHGERMRTYETTVREVVDHEVDSWPIGVPFAIQPRMAVITLEVILRAVFGVTDPARVAMLRDRLPRLLTRSSSPGLQFAALFARGIGAPDPLLRLRDLAAPVDEILRAEIADRRADPGVAAREDVLSLLISARFADGRGMDDAELRDQLMTLVLAGHETTATGLAWAFDLLLGNPRALERLTDEPATLKDAYARAVVAESLRLRPVIPLAGRHLQSELRTNELNLPPGTDVSPSIWLTHTRPEAYPEPFAFRPERFLDGPPDTYSWIPFGGGVRRCLGAAFAEFEMRTVLQAVLARARLRRASPTPERVARRNVTLSPRHGTPVVLTARRRPD
jgi:cytochrome P450